VRRIARGLVREALRLLARARLRGSGDRPPR